MRVQRRAKLEISGARCLSRRRLFWTQVQQLERVQFLARDRLLGDDVQLRRGLRSRRERILKLERVWRVESQGRWPLVRQRGRVRPDGVVLIARDRDADLV